MVKWGDGAWLVCLIAFERRYEAFYVKSVSKPWNYRLRSFHETCLSLHLLICLVSPKMILEFYVCQSVFPRTYACMSLVPSAWEVSRQHWSPWEWGEWVRVSCHVGSGNQTRVL